jgi:hypothetical protein
MKLSRALALAADGTDVGLERLRAIADQLDQELRRSAESRKPAKADATTLPPVLGAIREGARRCQANLDALQASRNLLVRAIAILK